MHRSATTKTRTTRAPTLLEGRDRLRLLRRIRGMWKNRKPTPIKELEKIRHEWERDAT